jgi:TPR repeat protein
VRLRKFLRSVSPICCAGLLTVTACHSRVEGRAQATPAPSSRPTAPLSDDPELAAAERAAIDKLSEFRNRLQHADSATQDFEVQALVREGALSEPLWLMELKSVEGGFEGSVRTQPQVLKQTQRAQQLRVANEDVLDWSYFDRGKEQGGATRIVLARQKRRAELADAVPKCIEKQYADGCAALGEGYANGRVGETNLEIALDLYTHACDGGSAYGCNAAGWATLHGKGRAPDLTAAAAFFARACPTGNEHPFACDSRGFALLSGLAGTKRDLSLAFRLLSKTCAQNLAPSCLLLELARVKGLRRGSKLDLACEVNFAEHVSRCTGEQDPESCFLAGSAIQAGVCGVPKSDRRSAELLRRASEFGAAWPN